MKKILVIVALAALFLPGYTQTPTEPCEVTDEEWRNWLYLLEIRYPLETYGDDTLATLEAILEDKRECIHHHYRPTDEEYFFWVNEKANFLCRTKYLNDFSSGNDYSHYLNMAEYHKAAALWRDLATWDSISAEEYEQLCDMRNYYIYDNHMESESWRYMSAIPYNRWYSYSDYLDIMQAHEQISRKIYGAYSQEHVSAAGAHMGALLEIAMQCTLASDGGKNTLQYMPKAKALGENVLRHANLPEDSISCHEWQLNYLSCCLEVDGPSKKLREQIDAAVKKAAMIDDDLLHDSFFNLRVEHELLANDAKRVHSILDERGKNLPALPNKDDENYYNIAFVKLLPYYSICTRAYMTLGEHELAYQYYRAYELILLEQNSDDMATIANNMLHLCGFPTEIRPPYTWNLQLRYIDHIFQWSGFRPE